MSTSVISDELNTSLSLCVAYSGLTVHEVLDHWASGRKYVYNFATESGQWQ